MLTTHNVPGAFSSNKGQDFKAVLEAVIGVKEPSASVPAPEKKGWPDADYYVGDGWSVAYRVLDAQWWGVPQRRKRIYLVADFADQSAPKVLFESEGVSRYSAEGFHAWQRAAAGAESGTGEAGFSGAGGRICLNDQGGKQMDVSQDVTGTLRAEAHGHQPCVLEAAGFCTEHSADARSIGYEEECSPTLRAGVVPAAIALENHPADSRVKISEDGKVQTLTSRCGTGGGNVPMVMDAVENSVESPVKEVENSPAVTLKIRSGCEGGGKGAIWQEEKSATLGCNNDQTLFVPKCYGVCSKASHSMMSDNPHSGFYEAETSRTLDRSGGDPTCNQGGICVVEPVAFTQNQRDEIRDLGEKSAALAAEPGMKQQTFVLQGNMIGRKDENGPQGDGVNEDVCFIAKKVRAALETNWKNGKATCTNVPFGYVWNKKGGRRWEIDPEAAPCVKKVFELALSGRNTTQIAYGMNELNLPTPGLYAKRKNLLMGSNPIIAPDSEMLWNAAIVWRILRRYEYTGALVMGRRKKIDVNTTSVRTLPEDKWIIAENAHAAIVTKGEYYQAQKAIRNVTPIQYKVGDDFALKGKICCGNCNRQLRHERQYGEMVFYCGYKRSAGKFSKCYGGYYREYSVNAKVARAIKTVFYALDVVNQGMQEKRSITVRCMDIEDLEKQAEAIRVEQIKLYESYADGVLRRDVYIEKKKTLSEKLAALQDSIRTEKEEQECADDLDEEIRALTKQASEKTYIGGLTKECVDAFVSMVYLYDDQTMKIEFNCEDVIRRALEKYGA